MQFQRRRQPEGEVLLAGEAAAAYSPAWFDAAEDPTASSTQVSGGRGGVCVFDTAVGTLLRRQYLRGGLPRHLSRDRYLWTGAERTRGFRELRVLAMLRQSGLPVPVPIAARYWRRGVSYRASLLMRLIPRTRTLTEALADGGDPDDLLRRTAEAIARLHHRRVWHADLNASNVLVDAQGQVWLIDFDRARTDVGDPQRLAGNLDRLLRSLRKLLSPPLFAEVQSRWPALHRHYQSRLATLSSPT